jgi:hypothetical protein
VNLASGVIPAFCVIQASGGIPALCVIQAVVLLGELAHNEEPPFRGAMDDPWHTRR